MARQHNNPIFNTKTASRMVGGYVPRPVADQFDLLSLYLNVSKNRIVQELIEEKLSQYDEAVMIEEIVQRVHGEWENRRLRNQGKHAHWRGIGQLKKRYVEYKQELKISLAAKHVSGPAIHKILAAFDVMMENADTPWTMRIIEEDETTTQE